jgi:hypothetical protein
VASGEGFDEEMALLNRRRLLVVLPLMVVVHVVHAAVFHVPAAERATLSPRIAMWRDGIVAAHGVTLAVNLTILGAALLFRGSAGPLARLGLRGSAGPLPRLGLRGSAGPLPHLGLRGSAGPLPHLLGPLAAATYLLHGAVVAAIDQLSVTSGTPVIAYCLGIAVLVALTPATAIAIYAAALVTFVAAMAEAQPVHHALLAQLPNGFSIVVVSVALAWLLHAGRRRDFAQRALIDRQRRELAELNADLERRVDAQVSEIVARADEVGRLNAQLQAQVRARSSELTTALARLAGSRHDDGSLRRGRVLGNRFEVGDPIGAGGMGAVYEGLDRSTGTRVAIKVMQAASSRQLDAWRRFLLEASTTATVDHPAIVRMVHVDVSDDGMLFQVQELVQGETLQRRLRAGQAWATGTVARFAGVLCDALASAHAAGIVHRDVKPSNVMLTAAPPGMKLLDFGIAKLLGDALLASEATGLTHTGAILGTPIYMGPEQLEGAPDVGERADLYAVGVILFLLLTGKHPFESTTPRGALVNCLVHDAPDARSLAPDLPDAMAEIVRRCLAKAPSERPTAAEAARALREIADARAVPPLEELERSGALHDARMQAAAHEKTATNLRGA